MAEHYGDEGFSLGTIFRFIATVATVIVSVITAAKLILEFGLLVSDVADFSLDVQEEVVVSGGLRVNDEASYLVLRCGDPDAPLLIEQEPPAVARRLQACAGLPMDNLDRKTLADADVADAIRDKERSRIDRSERLNYRITALNVSKLGEYSISSVTKPTAVSVPQEQDILEPSALRTIDVEYNEQVAACQEGLRYVSTYAAFDGCQAVERVYRVKATQTTLLNQAGQVAE